MKVSYEIHVPAIQPPGKQTPVRIEWQVERNPEPVSAQWIEEKYLPLLGIRILTLRQPSPNLLYVLLVVIPNPALKRTHENI
jgi:hypothetical protein